MAIYRCSVSIIGRAQGRNAIAAAAYRAGDRLAIEAENRFADYRRKQVAHAEIMAPAGAPAWATDRAQLWNAVEASETRKKSQLAREVQIALPVELSREQQIELAREWVASEFVSLGMVADLAIHDPEPRKPGQPRNPHAHVMLTLREVEQDGFNKRKARAWNDRQLVSKWRERWQDVTNKHLERAGRPERIDHRTIKAQAADRLKRHVSGRFQENKRMSEDDPNAELRAKVAAAEKRMAQKKEARELEEKLARIEAEIGGDIGPKSDRTGDDPAAQRERLDDVAGTLSRHTQKIRDIHSLRSRDIISRRLAESEASRDQLSIEANRLEHASLGLAHSLKEQINMAYSNPETEALRGIAVLGFKSPARRKAERAAQIINAHRLEAVSSSSTSGKIEKDLAEIQKCISADQQELQKLADRFGPQALEVTDVHAYARNLHAGEEQALLRTLQGVSDRELRDMADAGLLSKSDLGMIEDARLVDELERQERDRGRTREREGREETDRE